MMELPLFPLNTVLFPGTPITLHIFEPRYLELMEMCEQTQQPFGVVLIQEGQEALGPLATPYPIGCTAEIARVERLPDGRMNILAVGVERFEIHELDYDRESYLVGQVELLPLVNPDPARIDRAGQRLRPWVERYLAVLGQVAEDASFDPTRLPNDPLALGYLAAALVQIPTDQKQTLLAANEPVDLLANIRTIFRREVALLNAIIARDSIETQGLFSLN
jgi:Lon protease-like protein